MHADPSRADIKHWKELVTIHQLFEIYGIETLTRRSRCPWCQSEKPMLVLRNGRYRCYARGCHSHGDHLDFLQKFVGLTATEAVAELRRLSECGADLTLPEGYTGPRRARR